MIPPSCQHPSGVGDGVLLDDVWPELTCEEGLIVGDIVAVDVAVARSIVEVRVGAEVGEARGVDLGEVCV